MAKKRKKGITKGRPKGWLVSKKQVEEWLDQATNQILQEDYAGTVQTCRRILRYVPGPAAERGEALEHLATAYTMLKQFEESYQTLSQALEISPHLARLWHNRGLTGRYTLRLVQAVHDYEKAVELESDPGMRQKFAQILAQAWEMAESERALRGPDFTLAQLQEQQALFGQGLELMRQEKWIEAESAFRRVIDMADCLPQPNGNLGLTLLMQKRYDEAEAAFKRALEIEPDYDLAHLNLAALPSIRQSGDIPKHFIRNPMADAKISLTIQKADDD